MNGVTPPQGFACEIAVPLELDAIFQTLTAHAVPGMDIVDPVAHTIVRPLRLADGLVRVSLSLEPERVTGVITADSPVTAARLGETEAIVRHWFDLDADVAEVSRTLGGDPLLAPSVAARPGLRLTGYPSLWEATLMTVVGQQVSLAAARTFCGRLATTWGPALPDGILLPSPEELAGVTQPELYEAVRLTRARGNTVVAIAEAFASGHVSEDQEPELFLERLLALPGIGPWTVGYLAARALRLPDAFPAGDLVLRKKLGMMPERELVRFAQRWAPYRSYAALHVWAAADPLIAVPTS